MSIFSSGIVCVDLVFFRNILFAIVDTPLSESRFADYLDGWVEEKRETHDDHDVLESLKDELDDHGHDNEPFEEEEDNQEADDDDHSTETDDQNEIDGNDDEPDDTEHENGEDDEINENDDEPDDPEQENNDLDEENDSRDEENEVQENEIDDESREIEDSEDSLIEKNDIDGTDEGFDEQLSDDDTRPFEEVHKFIISIFSLRFFVIFFCFVFCVWQHVSKANTNPSSNQIDTNSTYVSAEDLKNQVDELYGHFNKLAESLNISKIKADNEEISVAKQNPMKVSSICLQYCLD